MYSFSYLEPVCCSMSSANCCFLTCIQISQEAGQVVWYSHVFQNFSQFTVIHTVKGFGIVNKAEIDVFLELSCFFDDPADVSNLISGSSAFSKTSLNIWKFIVNEAELDVFLEFPCFINDGMDVGNLNSGSSAFSKLNLNIWKFIVHVLWKPSLENFEYSFTGGSMLGLMLTSSKRAYATPRSAAPRASALVAGHC